MSEQDGTQASALQRPADNDIKAWNNYWRSQGQPWRLMREINAERQKYLAERRKIKPDIVKVIYPFKDIKLNRADIEWLLSTHENGRGPIDWSDKSQRGRYGLDLRGADLSGVNWAYLPLAGFGRVESEIAEEHNNMKIRIDRNEAAIINLVQANFTYAHLEGANFRSAHLEYANFTDARLEKATLNEAHLEGANFTNARLVEAQLLKANLKEALLWETQLKGANLKGAHLEGANIKYANFFGANIQESFFDNLTQLNGSLFGDVKNDAVALADVHWGDANLAVIDWSSISVLGDEVEAKKIKIKHVYDDSGIDRYTNYQTAVRAYRQLSVVLRNQGLNEDAARFTYRAQLMQRKIFWFDRAYAKWLGSLFLDLLSGYGYKPLRCFIAYLIVILSFALAYFIIGHKVGPVLSPLGSFVFSMTSFHGRGFFPGGIALDDPLTVVAAFEAFVGLLIEVTFIATLTQRLFGR